MDIKEFTETRVLKFEWVLRGVGELFESSKGDVKSKCIKSVLFGGGRWQIIFYANSGTTNSDGNGFVSVYLAAEPTLQEKENTAHGSNRWTRDGSYTFGFELRNVQRTICFQTKEARNHSFSWKTVNWGWAQFARRDAIYYNASAVRITDSFLISCTITEAPTPPSPPSPIVRQLVPKELLDVMGSMLDDPVYSDVEFVLPMRHGASPRSGHRKPRRIYASKKVLTRVDYFDTMFQSGFAECASIPSNAGNRSSLSDCDSSIAPPISDLLSTSIDDDMDTVSGIEAGPSPKFEDSDDEDDYYGLDSGESDPECEDVADETMFNATPPAAAQDENGVKDADIPAPQHIGEPVFQESLETLMDLEIADGDPDSRNVQRKLSHPSSPRSQVSSLGQGENEQEQVAAMPELNSVEKPVPGPDKVRVVIRDAAYATYRAVLYYIYTDAISFAPLASSFPSFVMSSPATNPGDIPTGPRHNGESTRRAWLKTWELSNPGKPRPCSAKAVYRLADKLDLGDLKERAFQHITKSLTVENVAYEVFSHFSAAFDDVRKIEISYFLEHWGEIRDSQMMRNVWQQIRLGRHPGFEEVWPLIATNLEYKSKESAVGRDNEKV